VYLVVERGHVAGTVRLLLIICLSFKWACGRMGGKMVNKVFFFLFFCLFVAPLCFSFSSSRESLSDVVVGNLDQAKHIFKEVAQV